MPLCTHRCQALLLTTAASSGNGSTTARCQMGTAAYSVLITFIIGNCVMYTGRHHLLLEALQRLQDKLLLTMATNNQLVAILWGSSQQDSQEISSLLASQDCIYLDFREINTANRVRVFSDPNTSGNVRTKNIRLVGSTTTGTDQTDVFLSITQDPDNTIKIGLR